MRNIKRNIKPNRIKIKIFNNFYTFRKKKIETKEVKE